MRQMQWGIAGLRGRAAPVLGLLGRYRYVLLALAALTWANARLQESKPAYVPPTAVPPGSFRPGQFEASPSSVQAARDAVRQEVNRGIIVNLLGRPNAVLRSVTLHNSSYATLVLSAVRCQAPDGRPVAMDAAPRGERVGPGQSFTSRPLPVPNGAEGIACRVEYDVLLP